MECARVDLLQRLRAAGLRATSPRLAVYRALDAADAPVSHAEMVAMLRGEKLDPATVYRNLVKLVEHRLARVAKCAGGIIRYELEGLEPARTPRATISCRSCGRVESIPAAKLMGKVDHHWRPSVESSEIRLMGECPGCLEKANAQGE